MENPVIFIDSKPPIMANAGKKGYVATWHKFCLGIGSDEKPGIAFVKRSDEGNDWVAFDFEATLKLKEFLNKEF
jgi:hypothetical protein